MAIGIICSSQGRNSSSYNRATPKALLLCVLAMGFGVCFGWSLSAPDTILLPDSFGPLRPPYHLAFGSSTNNIYVASESSDIIVVDGETFRRIERINTGTPVGSALLVSQHNKLYCSYPMQGRIGIIDCATNSVVGSIQVGTRPKLLCYSIGRDKLYCSDSINQTVSVIDCAADTVRKVISVGKGLTAMTYDPTTCKMYAATGDALLAISCSTDSIVANISEVKAGMSLCVNKRRQKLYITGRHVDTVYAISTQTDSVIATMKRGGIAGLLGLLACNEATDRLYCICSEEIAEFDCSGDTCTRSSYVSNYEYPAIACDTLHNRLYILVQEDNYVGSLVRFDGNDDLVAGAPYSWPPSATGAAYLWETGNHFDTVPDAWMMGDAAQQFVGGRVSTAGDLDGDGRFEFLVLNKSCNPRQHVWVCRYTGSGIQEDKVLRARNEVALGKVPNPCHDRVRFSCTPSMGQNSALRICDVMGRAVRTLTLDRGKSTAASPAATWDLRDNAGRRVCQGIHIVELEQLSGSATGHCSAKVIVERQ